MLCCVSLGLPLSTVQSLNVLVTNNDLLFYRLVVSVSKIDNCKVSQYKLSNLDISISWIILEIRLSPIVRSLPCDGMFS